MTGFTWPIGELLPHTGPAVLLDGVLACDDKSLSAEVAIHPGSSFFQRNGVPAYVGIEYMAQACGAFSGVAAKRNGEAPRMGFILGTRRYHATRAWFGDGQRLVVRVELVYRDGEVGVFDCSVLSEDEIVASAQLIVAEPRNATELLNSRGSSHAG